MKTKLYLILVGLLLITPFVQADLFGFLDDSLSLITGLVTYDLSCSGDGTTVISGDNSVKFCHLVGQSCENGACVGDMNCANFETQCSSNNQWVHMRCSSPIWSTYENCDVQGMVCENGECVEKETPECSDSDGGLDYHVKGVTYGPNENSNYNLIELYDNCYGPGGALTEFYCEEGMTTYDYITCENGCEDGACLEEPIHECTDSDGGLNYNVKGMTYGPSDNDIYNFIELNDNCYGPNNALTEFYCDNGMVTYDYYTCPYGCEDGVCLGELVHECTDTDGGSNYYLKGTITIDGVSKTDVCSGDTLYEYSCGEFLTNFEHYYCPNGCKDGSCIHGDGLPDFKIDSIDIELKKINYKDGYGYNVFVKNIGEGDASKSNLKVELHPSQPSIIDDYYKCTDKATFPLPMNDLIPGDILKPGEIERATSYFIPVQGGQITIKAIADPYNNVKESNEDNNILEKSFYVKQMINSEDCPNLCKNNVCEVTSLYTDKPNPPIDLSYYPNMIIKDNKLNAYIVVGDHAAAEDVISATDIAVSLQELTIGTISTDEDSTGIKQIQVGTTKLASEIKDPFNLNLISVGSPCPNAVTAKLLGNPEYCYKGFTPGVGYIRLHNYNGYVQIIVAGYSDQDTRKAAKVLANYKDYDLSSNEYLVKDTDVILCYSDDDCASEEEKFCNENNEACYVSTAYTCKNPGTSDSRCVASAGGGSCKFCKYGCKYGECIPGPGIKCVDSDNGQNEFIKGKTSIGDKYKVDTCLSSDSLEEFYCDIDFGKQTIQSSSMYCENGCEDGACKGSVDDCPSCFYRELCLPLNYRKDGLYCDITKNMLPQKKDNSDCQNDFECISNTCSSGRCLDLQKQLEESKTFMNKIWCKLTNLFDNEGYLECLGFTEQTIEQVKMAKQ